MAYSILTKQSDIFLQNKTIFDRIKPVPGNKGLVQRQGPDSKKMRKLIMPSLLSSTAMGNVSEIVLKNTNELISDLSIKNESFEVDISTLMTKLILRSAFEMFLGVDLNEIDDQIIKDYLELNSKCGDRMRSIMAMPLAVPTKRNQKIKKLSKRIRDEVSKIMKAKGTSPLLKVLDKDENLLDHCLTFLFAGHETMAASLSFSFLKLKRTI